MNSESETEKHTVVNYVILHNAKQIQEHCKHILRISEKAKAISALSQDASNKSLSAKPLVSKMSPEALVILIRDASEILEKRLLDIISDAEIEKNRSLS